MSHALSLDSSFVELPRLPGAVSETTVSFASSHSSDSGLVTKKNIVEILQQQGVPKKLIDQVDAFGDIAIKILHAPYIRFLRFRENDLPFDSAVCALLAKNFAIIKTSVQTLDDPIAPSVNCSCYDSLSNNKKDFLLAVAVIVLIFLLYFPFEKYFQGTLFMDFVIALRIIIPVGTLLVRIFSVREARIEKSQLKEKRKAQKNYDNALSLTKKVLVEQKEIIKEMGKQLILDFLDGFPFAFASTERDGELNKYKPADKKAMAFKAELIKYYSDQFVNKLPLVISSLQKLLHFEDNKDKVFQPAHLIEDFVSAVNTIAERPLPSQGENQEMADFYAFKSFIQTQFIKLAYSIDVSSVEKAFVINTANIGVVNMFPLSCGGFESAKELLKQNGVVPKEEKKSEVRRDSRRRESQISRHNGSQVRR